MAVDVLLSQVIATMTDLELAVFQARAERLTFPSIGLMVGVSENAARRAYERAQCKLGKAFMPLAYRELRAGTVDRSDLSFPKAKTSRHVGVSWHRGHRKWEARVGARYLGSFVTEDEAAAATNAARKETHAA